MSFAVPVNLLCFCNPEVVSMELATSLTMQQTAEKITDEVMRITPVL